MAGAPENHGTTAYVDGEPGHWYSQALVWAGLNGIIQGKGNGILDPKGKATRAELAAMLMRFAQLQG